MTSLLKVKLSHRRDQVNGERGRDGGVKGEFSVEITNRCSQMVPRHSRGLQRVRHHKILTIINTSLAPLKILKTEVNSKT